MIIENVIVMIADGLSDAKNMSHEISMISFESPTVPITDNFRMDRKLGVAILRKDGVNVVATLHLDIELHPRLAGRIFPCVGGVINPSGLEIEQIGLATQNVDSRIKSLGDRCGKVSDFH